MTVDLPLLALTLGDPSGTGPELLAKALTDPVVLAVCRPLVIGDARVLDAARSYTGCTAQIVRVESVEAASFTPGTITVVHQANADPAAFTLGQI